MRSIYNMHENMERYEQVYEEITSEEKNLIETLISNTTPTYAQDNPWASSPIYQKIFTITSFLNTHSESNNGFKNEPKKAHFSTGFRARNIIYYVDRKNLDNKYFLSILKHSKTGKYPDFWEFSKGGYERNIENLLTETAERELIEEVYDDMTMFDGITFHHSDRYSPILKNPDIIMIRKINEDVVHTHFDFITTYFIQANHKFNPEEYWKRSSLEVPEHLESSWDTIKNLREKFEDSAKKGFDRDYLYFKRILPHIPINKLYFMNKKEKTNLTQFLDGLFQKNIINRKHHILTKHTRNRKGIKPRTKAHNKDFNYT